jgi:hypothetical protein
MDLVFSLSNFSNNIFTSLSNFSNNIYTALSNFTNDLGYTYLSNFTNNIYTHLSNFTNNIAIFNNNVDFNSYNVVNVTQITISGDLTNHIIRDNSTCVIITGDTTTLSIC